MTHLGASWACCGGRERTGRGARTIGAWLDMAVMGKLSRPFPSAQFLLLCAVRFIDPLTFTQIFPYINQLLAALRLVRDPANIGFYSGLVVCLLLSHAPS